MYNAEIKKNESRAHYAPEPACTGLNAGLFNWEIGQGIIVATEMARLINYKKVKLLASPYSNTERRVPELIPVLGSQPAGEVSHNSS